MTREEPCFIWASQSWRDYLGWTHEEITETPFTEFIHPDDLEESMEAWARFVKTGELGFDGESFTNRYKTKSGFYKSIIWEAVLVGDKGYFMMEARKGDA